MCAGNCERDMWVCLCGNAGILSDKPRFLRILFGPEFVCLMFGAAFSAFAAIHDGPH